MIQIITLHNFNHYMGNAMQSKGNAPTAAQKKWREQVRKYASEAAGEPMQIHHPIGTGKGAKHNKVHIGHWWIIACDEQSHKDIHAGVFGHDRKNVEKRQFNFLITMLPDSVERPPQEAIEAIRNYSR